MLVRLALPRRQDTNQLPPLLPDDDKGLGFALGPDGGNLDSMHLLHPNKGVQQPP